MLTVTECRHWGERATLWITTTLRNRHRFWTDYRQYGQNWLCRCEMPGWPTSRFPGRRRLCSHERDRDYLQLLVDSGLMNPVTNSEKVAHYLRSIENGDFAYIADLFSPDAV